MKANIKLIRKKRNYSQEFKDQIVKDFETGKFSVPQLEKLHGIDNPTIYNWIYKYSTFNERGYRIMEMKKSSTSKIRDLEELPIENCQLLLNSLLSNGLCLHEPVYHELR